MKVQGSLITMMELSTSIKIKKMAIMIKSNGWNEGHHDALEDNKLKEC